MKNCTTYCAVLQNRSKVFIVHSTTEQVKTDEKISKYCIIVKSSVQQYAYQPSVEPWVSLERDLQAEAIALRFVHLFWSSPLFQIVNCSIMTLPSFLIKGS